MWRERSCISLENCNLCCLVGFIEIVSEPNIEDNKMGGRVALHCNSQQGRNGLFFVPKKR